MFFLCVLKNIEVWYERGKSRVKYGFSTAQKIYIHYGCIL